MPRAAGQPLPRGSPTRINRPCCVLAAADGAAEPLGRDLSPPATSQGMCPTLVGAGGRAGVRGGPGLGGPRARRLPSPPPQSLPCLLTVTLPPLLLFSRTAARPSRGRGHPWPQGLLCRGLHGLSTPSLLRWTRGPQEGRSNPRSFTHGLIWGKRSLQSDKAENLEVRPPWILLVGFASNDRCVPSKGRKRRATDAGDALGRDRGRSGMTTGQGAPGVSGSSTAFQPRGAADGPTDAIGTPGRAE